MKFLLMTVLVCFAILMVVSAVPVQEGVVADLEGVAGSEPVNPTDDKAILLKLKLFKKLLFLG